MRELRHKLINAHVQFLLMSDLNWRMSFVVINTKEQHSMKIRVMDYGTSVLGLNPHTAHK